MSSEGWEGKRICQRLVLASVGRRFEAREKHLDAAGLRSRDDVREVLLHLARGKTAEAVVRSEREDQDLDPAPIEHPVEAPHSAGAGISRDPRIHHLVGVAPLVEELLEHRGIGFVEPDPQTCSQAVAEGHEAHRSG